jgi:pro-apoptotic serine protease NMA111
LDAEKGLIVVGRSIVPFNMGDVSITVADSLIIPATVVYLHPTHNLTFLSYDPTLLGGTPVRSAEWADAGGGEGKALVQGYKVMLVALNHNYKPVCIETMVTDISSVTIPQNSTPRFRAINFGKVDLCAIRVSKLILEM